LVNDILKTFGRKIVSELKNNLNTYGYKGGRIDASGQLRDSIKFTARVLGDDYSFQLSMADYYKWVDEGRKAGKWAGQYPTVNPNNILRWMQTKNTLNAKISGGVSTSNRAGIRSTSSVKLREAKSLAFLISRKIKTKGIKPTNFFSDVYNDEALLELKKNISKEIQKDIKIELTRIA